jgi:hypothetical protein
MTVLEKKAMLGYRPRVEKRKSVDFKLTDLPTSVNWVTAGAVNPVQN